MNRSNPRLLRPCPVQLSWLLCAGVLVVFLGSLWGCGPAFRFRPANTMPKGNVEMFAGFGMGGRIIPTEAKTEDDGTTTEAGTMTRFGGAEITAGIRGAPSHRSEVGYRFWTYSLSTFGNALEIRIAAVKKPFDLTFEFGGLFGMCCGLGNDQRIFALGGGFDAGFSVGKRFGDEKMPAFYVSPHFQMTWTFPPENYWPYLLYIPIGLDIPLGTTIFALRPELTIVVEFYPESPATGRVAGGIGLGIQLPSPKSLKEKKKAKKAEDEQASLGNIGPWMF